MTPARAALTLALAAACGGATPSPAPTTTGPTATGPTATGPTTPGASTTATTSAASTGTAAGVPLTWDAVRARATAVYRGRLLHRPDAAEPFCEVAEEAHGAAAATTLPHTWCAPDDQPLGFGWAPAPGAPAWIVTEARDGDERPWLALACEGGACGDAPPTHALTRTAACSALQAIDSGGGLAGTTCSTDADCVAVQANCFGAVVHVDERAGLQAALDAWWSDCQGPGAGMCPRWQLEARCDAGTCRGSELR
ncbi:MAG: hypothetical protein R2939_10000 [Kofleriaceae bacterium]